MIRTIVLDEGWTTTTQAEHGTHERVNVLGLRAVLACTHFLPADGDRAPRVAVTVQLAEAGDEPGLAPVEAPPAGPVLDPLLADHLGRRAGRAFVFPGMADLDRIVTVATLLAQSAVDDVIGMGGVVARPTDRLDTQNHLRPEFTAGRLVLRVRPKVGANLVPFEQPNPTPCCASHS